MLTFKLDGSIGRIEPLACGALRIAVASRRLVKTDSGAFAVIEWVTCTCHDIALCAGIEAKLFEGANAELSGEIHPRQRQVGGFRLYDVAFVVTGFRALGLRRGGGK